MNEFRVKLGIGESTKLPKLTKICRIRGQKYIKIIFSLFLLLGTASIFSQERNQSSLYLGTIDIGSGISKDRETKIRNGITINLIRKYKEKFRIIDDETVKNLLGRLKIQQQIGCSTEKCERMIDDALNADYKITGSITMESSRLQLTLKLFRFRDMTPSLENQVEKTFAQSQFEYYIAELTSALVDPRYAINDSNAPSEIELGKVDLSKITIKEVAGSDLKLLEFKTSEDTEINDTLNTMNPILVEGDIKFKDKNFTDALLNYRVILKQLKKVSYEKKSTLTTYIDGINKRIEQACDNLYSSKIGILDKELLKFKELSREDAESFVSKYELIKREYENEIQNLPKSEEILKGISERTEKIDVSNYANQEKIADGMYDSYKFSPAIREYNQILSKVKSKPNTPTYIAYRERIKTKIDTTKVTGTSFIKNKFNTYLNLAKSKNPAYGGFRDTKKEKEAQEILGVIEDALLGAKNILIVSEFSDDSMLIEYNALVDRINRDNSEYAVRFAERLERSKLRTGEIETVGVEYPFFHFPGMPQRERELNDKKNNGQVSNKTNTLIYGSYSSLVLTGLGSLLYQIDYQSYQNTTGTSPIVYYALTQNSGNLGFLLMVQDQAKFSSAYSKVESSAGIVNGGIGLLGIFIILSHIDLLTTTKSVDTLGRIDGIPLYRFERGGIGINARTTTYYPTPRNQGQEMQYTLEYNYQF